MHTLSQETVLSLDAVTTSGSGLTRPESVWWHEGDLYTSDAKGAIAHVRADGATRLLGLPGALPDGVRPNGIARRPDGSFIFANLGEEGGVWSVDTTGRVQPLVRSVDGRDLPSTNFVLLDEAGRIWICVSSTTPGCSAPGYHFDRAEATGYIAVVDTDGSSRIVADHIGWTNECRLDPTGTVLYVNETIGRRMIRFDVNERLELSNRQTVAEFESGIWPDGLELDAAGDAWITSPISNRVVQVFTATGRYRVILEDYDEESLRTAEEAFQRDAFHRTHFYRSKANFLKHLTSLTFSGDQRTAYLGSLNSDAVYQFSVDGLIGAAARG
ncbi:MULTISPECIES: SMP-30/gluconolactonase/LRE family protein [unclassified Caballeronia]|uniref:SMP-30/gluconolactonase/LRE family protein n=1 Tax=unclassified Caballeronia TaxID=2646786 RepID=UPI002855174D|nr:MULTISPECIES: SMP-30/gluconolactonase/LRE family protein [unclassified Caballeronia]MDR5815702.1 SMP-30/gluconolactonase/LRE family protein [Caballeronia sp. LZ033]MDR5883444.1 SMP-30/gluconolactonase/LRE family protein [Caballeronia sp. LZ032]